MKNENVNVDICPPCGENVALATKRGANKVNPILPLLPRLSAVLPPPGREMSFGFTLIELLVVVLIIGILAAIAVPQYKKAVLKSRLAQWDVIFNTAQKAIDAYLLENGWPASGMVYLTGKNRVGTVEMPGNCDIDDQYCYTLAGGVFGYCAPSTCDMGIYGSYNAGGAEENKALGDDGPKVIFRRMKASDPYIVNVSGKAGCLWVSAHPEIPVASAKITACKDTYGVTLPNPTYP